MLCEAARAPVGMVYPRAVEAEYAGVDVALPLSPSIDGWFFASVVVGSWIQFDVTSE